MTNAVFGDPCVGTFKYLQLTFECVCPGGENQIKNRSILLAGCKLEIIEGMPARRYLLCFRMHGGPANYANFRFRARSYVDNYEPGDT